MRDAGAIGPWQAHRVFSVPVRKKNVHFQATKEIDEIGQIVSLLGRNSVGGIFASKMTHDHRARLEETLRRNIRDYNGIESAFPITNGFT